MPGCRLDSKQSGYMHDVQSIEVDDKKWVHSPEGHVKQYTARTR